MQPCRAPKVFGDAAIELLPGVQVGYLEFGMGVEWEHACFRKPQESRTTFIGKLMKALSQQVLLQVVFAFFSVWEVPVARIEGFWQQQEAAKAVPVFPEIGLVRKLVFMTVGVIGPDMFGLVTVLPFPLNVFHIAGRHAGTRLDVICDPREQAMDLPAIHCVKAKTIC